jgi:hypothetical protein
VSRFGEGTKMMLCLPLRAGASVHTETTHSVAEDRQ